MHEVKDYSELFTWRAVCNTQVVTDAVDAHLIMARIAGAVINVSFTGGASVTSTAEHVYV